MFESIHTISVGDGEPTFLFVHGICCSLTDWADVTSILSSRYRCVSLDLPGHGLSKGAAVRMVEFAGCVNSIKDNLKQGRVILVGHSLGAKVIREAYRQSPEAVAGIVLVDSSLPPPDADMMRRNAKEAASHGGEHLVSAMFTQQSMFGPKTAPAVRERILERALACDPEFACQLFLDVTEWDIHYSRETIERTRVPILVLQSTYFDSNFQWTPLAKHQTTRLIDEVRAHSSKNRIVVMEGYGHFPMIEAPESIAQELSVFADSLAK